MFEELSKKTVKTAPTKTLRAKLMCDLKKKTLPRLIEGENSDDEKGEEDQEVEVTEAEKADLARRQILNMAKLQGDIC